MKKETDRKYYDLIPSQQTMYLMVKYSFSKQLTQIPTAFTISEDLDFELLTKALNIEFQRNDSFRIRFEKKDKKLMQYFLPEVRMNKVPCKYFRSLQQQQEFFAKDAQKPIYFLKDECYRIYFFKTVGQKNGIYLNVSHLNMDAIGVTAFFLDLMAIYEALWFDRELPDPLYSYEEYIQQELARVANDKKREKHEKFYREYFAKGGEPFYAGVHGPAFLEKQRIKKKNPDLRVPAAYNPIYDKCNMVTHHIGPEDAKKIFDFCLEHSVAPESLFMFGLRCHVSALNYRTEDVFMMATCSKRSTVKEKRMGGCLTQPIQVRTIIPETSTFMDGINEYTSVRTQLYRHMDYPYITARDMSRDMYNYSLIQGPACMMFSWIPVPLEFPDGVEINFHTYDLGRYFTPLYTICSPDPEDKGINLRYMYRVKLSERQHIEALNKNALKVILAGIENPQLTCKELLDMCEENIKYLK